MKTNILSRVSAILVGPGRRWLAATAAAGLALSAFPPMTEAEPSSKPPAEQALRQALGIPPEAARVIVFAQSSHWDPDWLLTSDEYQRFFTDRVLNRALEELEEDPRYIYSVENVFFFKRFWESHPEARDRLRHYVNAGRIRFTGTGLTTPDTLLPSGESIVRDYLVGYRWLKEQGLQVKNLLTYLPDSFGHSPSLPSILREMGQRYAAVTRIDGMFFPGANLLPKSAYPWPGSSAELLQRIHRSTDFVWRASDGSEVITHWNAFTYYQGDSIALNGLYLAGLPLGLPARRPRQTNRKIDSYIEQLSPLSPTGYLFCPIGGDFLTPIDDLVAILDTYNEMRYPRTGVFAVLASLEDYLRLVEFHRDQLPVLELDPNPYWTGFYSSRPEVKRRSHELVQSLLVAEQWGIWAEYFARTGFAPDLAAAWETAVISNHHDFITGTATDRVVRREQIPLLAAAQAEVDDALQRLREVAPLPLSEPNPAPMDWWYSAEGLVVANDYYELTVDPERGGCITSWLDLRTGREMLDGPSNDIVIYRDSGGLWRMGHELRGGEWTRLERASQRAASVEVEELAGVVRVRVVSQVQGHHFTRELYFRGGTPVVRMKLRGAVDRRRTATVQFVTALRPSHFVQQVPYGVVSRPLTKHYSPTFWPVRDWLDLGDEAGDQGVSLFVQGSGSVTVDPEGRLQLVGIRLAPRETAYGIIPLGVASGGDVGEHEVEYALAAHDGGDWLTRQIPRTSRFALSPSFIDPNRAPVERLPEAMFQLDRDDVLVTSVKAAEDGSGIVVRLFRYAPGPVTVTLTSLGGPIVAAQRTDGLERDPRPLPVQDGQVEVDLAFSLQTIIVTLDHGQQEHR